jgi:hypothetical protein
MKEVFSAFGTEIFRPLITLVLPGVAALSSWFLLAMKNAKIYALVNNNHTEATFVLVMIALFMGLVAEDIGSRIERSFDSRRDRMTDGAHMREWWAYLRLAFEVEPAGRRHLRNLVARLKFELGIPVGLLICIPGIWMLDLSYKWSFGLTILGVVVGLYLFCEAVATHRVLASLRHELLGEIETYRASVARAGQ